MAKAVILCVYVWRAHTQSKMLHISFGQCILTQHQCCQILCKLRKYTYKNLHNHSWYSIKSKSLPFHCLLKNFQTLKCNNYPHHTTVLVENQTSSLLTEYSCICYCTKLKQMLLYHQVRGTLYILLWWGEKDKETSSTKMSNTLYTHSYKTGKTSTHSLKVWYTN